MKRLLKKKQLNIRFISLSLAKQFSVIVFSIIAFELILYPVPSFADFLEEQLEDKVISHLPVNQDREYTVSYEKYTTITAYNSDPWQTDSTPCITANGFDVCAHGIEDTIAANFLRFGTKVRIPELFGDRIFTVRDRMNSRYTNRVDVWMLSNSDARTLGKRLAKIEILE